MARIRVLLGFAVLLLPFTLNAQGQNERCQGCSPSGYKCVNVDEGNEECEALPDRPDGGYTCYPWGPRCYTAPPDPNRPKPVDDNGCYPYTNVGNCPFWY